MQLIVRKHCEVCRTDTTHYIIHADGCRATVCLKCAERITAEQIGVAECQSMSNSSPASLVS